METNDIPQEFYTAFSNATGIPENNISIIIYTIPEYIEVEEEGTNFDLIFTIVLFVIIIALLIFVVFRVSKPEEVVETEPELSVEKLLATTKDNQSLEDIEFSEKSESKRLIEKFVDENPEAENRRFLDAVHLLRLFHWPSPFLAGLSARQAGGQDRHVIPSRRSASCAAAQQRRSSCS